MATCDKCGSDFNLRKVREKTDDYYGYGRYGWVQGRFGTFCEDCIDYYLYLEDEDGNEVDPENVFYPD